MRRLLAMLIVVSSAGVVLAQGNQMNVVSDPRAKVGDFKTFSIGKGTVESVRFELNNRLFIKMIGDAIHDALVAKGLKETADKPDLVATFDIAGEEVLTSERSMIRGAGPRPTRFSEGTLTIDLKRPGETDPVWRGTFLDTEDVGSKLVTKLPEDARKLLAKLPR